MSSDTHAPPEPQRHVHRRTHVEDVLYDGTEASRHQIARWAMGTGNLAQVCGDDLLVKTQVKWARVPPEFWVGLGVVGQLWVISGDVHLGCYDPAGPDFNAIVDRDTAAAMVVAADEAVERLHGTTDAASFPMVKQLQEYVHQLAASCEALR